MNIEIGSEKRFLDFIQGLRKSDKICLISHTDLDGISAAVVANKVLDADEIKFVNYGELNVELIQQLKQKGFNKLVFTDLFIKEDEFVEGLNTFERVLILDHHDAKDDLNSDKIVFVKVEKGYCAAYLCYEFFRKIQDVSVLDWLVVCASISDFCNVKNSNWIRRVYERYGEVYDEGMDKIGFRLEDLESSKFYELQWKISLALVYFRHDLNKVFESIGESFADIGNLGKYAEDVQEEIDETLKDFEKQKKEFPGGYYFQFEPKFKVSSLVNNLISQKYPDKTLVFIRRELDGYVISLRRQDSEEDMNMFVRKLLEGFEKSSGGGHVPAAGGYFPAEYILEFKKRLRVKD